MEEQTKWQLFGMIGLMQQAVEMNDPYASSETRMIWEGNAAAIQAYASCQIALQMDRIATILEKMYQSPNR